MNDDDVKVLGDDLLEWKKLLDTIYNDEEKLSKMDDDYKKQEMHILQTTNFEKLYNGRNNEKIRKAHVKKSLKALVDEKENLELKIEHNKRMVSFLKAAVYRKTELMRLK